MTTLRIIKIMMIQVISITSCQLLPNVCYHPFNVSLKNVSIIIIISMMILLTLVVALLGLEVVGVLGIMAMVK